jgi:hypothetical protein
MDGESWDFCCLLYAQFMPNLPGAIPTAKGRSPIKGRDNVLRPFDRTHEVLEKRGAPPPYSSVIWPLLVGLALAVFAPKLMDTLGSLDPWIERAVFPYVLLAQRPEFGLKWEFSGYLPRVILFAQFPIEGLLTVFNLRRRFPMWVAIGQLIVIHLIGAFALFLLITPRAQ